MDMSSVRAIFNRYALLASIAAWTCVLVSASSDLSRVEGVGAGVVGEQDVIVYWNSIDSSSNRPAMYTVYYESLLQDNRERGSVRVQANTNFAIISNLRPDTDSDYTYTFQVSASFIVNSSLVEGPRSVMTDTSRLEFNTGGITMKDIASILFGLLLMVSATINIVLLLVNYILLRRFRKSMQFIRKVHSMSDISSQKSPSSTKGEVFEMTACRGVPAPMCTRMVSVSSKSSSARSVRIASIQEEEDDSLHTAESGSSSYSDSVVVESNSTSRLS